MGVFCLLSNKVMLPLKSPEENMFSEINLTFENLSDFEFVYFSEIILSYKFIKFLK